MERLKFEDYEELSCNIVDKLDEIIDEDEFNDIAIVAKYEEARQVIKELLCIGCELHSIKLHDEFYDNYTDEYIVSVNKTGEEYSIWCEPMLRENGYLTDDSKVIYVFDNCSSKVIPYCKGETVYEVCVGEEEQEDDCSLECQDDSNASESTYISRKKDGTPTGFQKTWYTEEDGLSCYSSYSHYSNDVGMLREIAEEFGVKL